MVTTGNRARVIVILGIALALLAAAIGGFRIRDNPGSGPSGYVYDGLQENLTLVELAKRADAVVVGDVTQISQRRVTDRAAITEGLPDSVRDSFAYGYIEHTDAVVRVVEYLKGDGPQAIRVPFGTKIASEGGATPPVEPSGAALEKSRSYILFITKGIPRLWVGRWLLMGDNGVLAGDGSDTFRQVGSGVVYSLDDVRQAVEESSGG